MTSYPLCEEKTVVLQKYPTGTRETTGVCYNDLAVVRILNSPDFTIAHMPSGFTFKTAACIFRYQPTAVAAMMEIAKIRNRWRFDDIKDLQALQPQIEAIATRYGGVSAARGPDVLDYKEDKVPDDNKDDIPYSSTRKRKKP